MAIPIVLAILGAAYHAIASEINRRSYPPPGRLVDVGGYKLHIHCIGEGSPTVILDAANQGTVSNWIWIQSELANTTRVCAYDRSGLGWSDLSPEPQDTEQNSLALHTLLSSANVPPPYVLVEHSLYRIEGATHISLVDRQEHADQARTAILNLVEAVRNP